MSDRQKAGYASAFGMDHVARLVSRIGADMGTPMTLVRRFTTGDGPGAYELSSHDGRRLVLKLVDTGVDRLERAAAATSLLRSRGYPAPEFVAVGRLDGTGYSLQEMSPGELLSSSGVRERHVPVLLAINDAQADGFDLGGPAWPAPVVDSVLYGGAGFCLIETMLDHSPQTAALMRRLQDVVSLSADKIPTGRRDVVHFDFNPANVLASGADVTGVIDWEGVHAGDRAFDLVTFGWSCPGHRRAFFERAASLSGAAALRVYVAHMIHRLVEWSVRFYPQEVARNVAVAEAYLRNLPVAFGGELPGR